MKGDVEEEEKDTYRPTARKNHWGNVCFLTKYNNTDRMIHALCCTLLRSSEPLFR